MKIIASGDSSSLIFLFSRAYLIGVRLSWGSAFKKEEEGIV
jgi:hypothetical protein